MAADPREGAEIRLVDTPEGPGRAAILRPGAGAGAGAGATPVRGTVLLGHGAGGQKDSKDLAALAAALPTDGWVVALIDQPWRVAGKKVASLPPRLDAAYVPLAGALMDGADPLPRPLVSAGRSAGARVACRTAGNVAAAAVIALSFPLHPPGQPHKSRYAELEGAVQSGVPVLVVQGVNDPFGSPGELAEAGLDPGHLQEVRGTHTPHPSDVVSAVRDWLANLTL